MRPGSSSLSPVEANVPGIQEVLNIEQVNRIVRLHLYASAHSVVTHMLGIVVRVPSDFLIRAMAGTVTYNARNNDAARRGRSAAVSASAAM
jgi:hypothetical protein